MCLFCRFWQFQASLGHFGKFVKIYDFSVRNDDLDSEVPLSYAKLYLGLTEDVLGLFKAN